MSPASASRTSRTEPADASATVKHSIEMARSPQVSGPRKMRSTGLTPERRDEATRVFGSFDAGYSRPPHGRPDRASPRRPVRAPGLSRAALRAAAWLRVSLRPPGPRRPDDADGQDRDGGQAVGAPAHARED